MALHILIVEDDKYFNKLLADTLSSDGHQVKTALDGNTALRFIEEHRFDLAVVDMLLPRVMGSQLCREIKNKRPELPIIVISGVYKNPDQIDEIKKQFDVAAYLCKPFNIDELITVIKAFKKLPENVASGSATKAAGDLPVDDTKPLSDVVNSDDLDEFDSKSPIFGDFIPEGSLQTFPLPHLLIRNYFAIETGILTLQNGSLKRKIFFSNGFPVFATSTALSETLGAVLKKKSIVSDAELNAASREMVERGVFLGQVLIEKGTIKSDDFYKVLREQIYGILINSFGWREGTYSYEPTKVLDENILKIEFNPMLLIYMGLSKFTPMDAITAFFDTNSKKFLHATEHFNRLLPLLNLKGQAKALLEHFDSSLSIDELLKSLDGKHRDGFSRILNVLVQTGMLMLHDSAAPRAPDRSIQAAELSSVDFSDVVQSEKDSLDETIQSDIAAQYVRVMNQNYFELLQVPSDVDEKTLNKAYMSRLKTFDINKLDGKVTGESKRMLNEILAKIEQAYRTLRDQNSKTAYDAFSSKKSYDSATEAKLYLDAQELYHEANGALKQNNFLAANALFQKASEKWPKAAEYHLFAIYSQFLSELESNQNREKAKQVFSNYLVLEGTNAGLDIFYLLKGHMHLKLNNLQDAKRAYQDALNLNPHSDEIRLALQTIGGRERKLDEYKGLFKLYKSIPRKLAATAILALACLSVVYHFGFFIQPDTPVTAIDVAKLNNILPFTSGTKTKDTIELRIAKSHWAKYTPQKLTELMAEVDARLAPELPREIIVYDELNQPLARTIKKRSFFYGNPINTRGNRPHE